MKREFIVPFAGVLVVLIALIAYLHGANIPVLTPAGPVAAGELRVIVLTVLLCAIIAVPVFVLLFFFAWKYRAGSPEAHVQHRPDWDHDSLAAEFIWWV